MEFPLLRHNKEFIRLEEVDLDQDASYPSDEVYRKLKDFVFDFTDIVSLMKVQEDGDKDRYEMILDGKYKHKNINLTEAGYNKILGNDNFLKNMRKVGNKMEFIKKG